MTTACAIFCIAVAIVSNHEDLRTLAEQESVPFIHLPVTKESKPEQEARLLEIVAETGTELVVLARYMQILSDTLCKQLAGRDEGPIIEQMVERVTHSHDSQHLTLVGRDTEAQTLARAVKNHVRHRVFLNGLRTVVF